MKAFIQKQVDKIDEALEKNRQFLKNRQQKRSQFLKNRQHEGPEDDNWDLEQANVLADVLAIARQERVAIAKEYEENKQKLLKDMKEFYAGKVEEEEFYAFKAEDPEEEPKASGSRARMRRKKPASSKAARSKRLRRMAARSKRLRQLLEA